MLNYSMSAVDFITAFAILASGNTYTKISLMAKFANIIFVNKSTSHCLQKHILIPTIDNFWKKHQRQLATSMMGQKLVMLGK